MIIDGSTVDVHYTGKHITGEIFDSSEGKDPITFVVGQGQLIPGFENAIIGKSIGDKLTVNIQPKDGYGEVREDMLVSVPNTQLPGPVTVGQALQAHSEDGQPINVVVKEVYSDHIVIDGNHPFAGKELVFDIEIVDVK